MAVLADQAALFGPVASDSTCWRLLDRLDGGQLGGIARARAAAREVMWAQRAELTGQPFPPARAAGRVLPGLVVDLDASIVVCHSEKELAAPTFKKTFGFHPMLAFCDNTGEFLAATLRRGNAGSNTAADHITVLDAPGIGISHEAARWRLAEGSGADLSWRRGAEGGETVAEILAKLIATSRLDRFRGRGSAWRVLNSVPIGTGRGDVDHVLVGPPGVVTINTKHHRAGRIHVDGDELIVNRYRTDYIAKARREDERARSLLGSALAAAGQRELVERLVVRSLTAVVGGRVEIESWPPDVPVVMTRQLLDVVMTMRPALNPEQIDTVFSVARCRAAWTRAT